MTISVIIPTRNRAALLRQAIESVLAQEPCGIAVEILVVDDASTDDTMAVASSFPGVRYTRVRAGSAAGSRNAGLARATGEWIAFLDDDDVWLPRKLRVCRALMSANPSARFVYSAATLCDESLRPKDRIWLGPDLERGQSPRDAFLDTVMCPSVVVMHREVFAAVGTFDPSVPRAEDRDMWLRAVYYGVACAGTSESLVLYRERDRIDGKMDYATYHMTMAVLRRYIGDGVKRPSRQAACAAVGHVRGWYAHRLLLAARQAARDGEPRQAAYFRRLAFNVSPLHATKGLLGTDAFAHLVDGAKLRSRPFWRR